MVRVVRSPVVMVLCTIVIKSSTKIEMEEDSALLVNGSQNASHVCRKDIFNAIARDQKGKKKS